MGNPALKLYWTVTEDHAEDWFIIASDETEAAREFEKYEGYDPGEATAEYILDIPSEMIARIMEDEFEVGDWRWPSHDTLVALGATFIVQEPVRVVEILGTKYSEGMMDDVIRTLNDNAFESLGLGRPNDSKAEDIH
jgi:hypothetical protein